MNTRVYGALNPNFNMSEEILSKRISYPMRHLEDVDLPVYQFAVKDQPIFSFIISTDISGDRRSRFIKFMDNQTQPLIEGLREDAVAAYLTDYMNFLHLEKTGREMFWD